MAYAASLFRYPVKSMQGERVERLEFAEPSATGDRRWALLDVESGLYLSAKRHGRLLEASARTEPDGAVVIRLPDGSELEAADPAASPRLSDWLGRAVELRRPTGATSPSYEGLDDALDEGSGTHTFSGSTTHFADFADVHLLTTASLLAAKALRPSSDWDVRRFRPTMLLETGDEQVGFVEDAWIGSRVIVGGGATFEVFMKTIRCNLPTRSQPGLERDTAVARLLRNEHEFCLGVYGAFRRGGLVATGDPVTIDGGPSAS